VAVNETSGIQGETNDVAVSWLSYAFIYYTSRKIRAQPGDGYVGAVKETSGIQDETHDVANFSVSLAFVCLFYDTS
jgi:hypothetical protein